MAIPQVNLPSCLAELPYTLPYLQEAFFIQIPETASWPTGWAVDRERLPMDMKTSSTLCDVELRHGNTQITLSTDALQLAPVYWEMTILGTRRRLTKSSKLRGRIEVGFGHAEYGGVKVTYNSNGDVIFGESTRMSEPYGPEDTIGCGYVAPGHFIFTKNGVVREKLFAHVLDMVPCTRMTLTAHPYSKIRVRVNFGQTPFTFNFREYFKLKMAPNTTRARKLVSSIPVEILEVILQHALYHVDTDLDSKERSVFDSARRFLSSLLLVCPRWNDVCSRRIFGTMQLTGPADIRRAWKSRHLSTHERPSDPWLHHLLLSNPPCVLVLPQEWTCASSLPVSFMGKLPPRLSAAFHSLPRRRHFACIRKLVLECFGFPSWAQLARLIFGFSQLEELHLNDVTWNINPRLETPPRWVRSSRRVGAIYLKGSNCSATYRHGALWLLTSHTRTRTTTVTASSSHDFSLTSEDCVTIGNITKLLCLWCAFDTILYTALNDIQCTISCINADESTLMLQLVKPVPMASAHQLLNVNATLEAPIWGDEWGLYRLRLRRCLQQYRNLLSRLSNANDNTCRLRLLDGHLETDWQPAIDDQRGTITSLADISQLHGLDDIPQLHGVARLDNMPQSMSQWLSTISWHSEKTGTITHFRKAANPWVKLFESQGAYVADVPYEVDDDGLGVFSDIEFTLPEVQTGRYFIAVGDYPCCTEEFEVEDQHPA